MAGPGLEPVFDKSTNVDKTNQEKVNIETYHAHINTNTDKRIICNPENVNQVPDNKIIDLDKLKAQYKQNEIPEELIKLISGWSKIPDSVAKGILCMVECYI